MPPTFQSDLANARHRLNLTQSQLAARLSVSKRTVELWLSGERVPMAITQEGALARLTTGAAHEPGTKPAKPRKIKGWKR